MTRCCLLVALLLLPCWALADSDPTLERIQQLEQELSEGRSKLEDYEARARELLAAIRTSEAARAKLNQRIAETRQELRKLEARRATLDREVTALERRIAHTREKGILAASLGLSLTRGGQIELLLSLLDPVARLRTQGTLRATLTEISRLTSAWTDDLQRLDAARAELDSNRRRRKQALASLETDRAQAEERQRALERSLALVRKDTRLTRAMLDDLEQDRRNMLEMLQERRRRRDGLVSLDLYRSHIRPPIQGGQLLLAFGRQRDPVFGVEIEHPGLTWKVPRGTEVRAVAPGEVAWSGWLQGYGNLVVLAHGDDYFTLYGYLDSIRVERGQSVDEGTVLGLSGDSGSMYGPALHFEIRHRKSPVDPATWFASR